MGDEPIGSDKQKQEKGPHKGRSANQTVNHRFSMKGFELSSSIAFLVLQIGGIRGAPNQQSILIRLRACDSVAFSCT